MFLCDEFQCQLQHIPNSLKQKENVCGKVTGS